MRSERALGAAFLLLATVSPALAERPADELLRLAPADSAVTITVEGLRGTLRDVLDSQVGRGLEKLPTVQQWKDSGGLRSFEDSRREIEKVLGADLTKVRDEVFGDAVLLSLEVPAGGRPDQARGLLLTRFRDKDLLKSLVDRINAFQMGDDTLAEVETRSRGKVSYAVRKYKQGAGRPDEAYVILGDVFAWSNSEEMIKGVIDRRGGGLADDAGFKKVRDALPEGSLVSLFVNPRAVDALIPADAKTNSAAEERVVGLVRSSLKAAEYAGASIEWKDGFFLHVHAAMDPSKLDDSLRRVLAKQSGGSRLLARAPATVLALGTAHVNFSAIYDEAIGFIPAEHRPKIEKLSTVLQGVLLGKDPRKEVLPALGPGVLLYADAPVVNGSTTQWPIVLVVGVGDEKGDSGVSAAIENAVRTGLALGSLAVGEQGAAFKVDSREASGVKVTTLQAEGRGVAFGVGRGFLVVGNSTEAVAGYFADKPTEGKGESPLARIRAAHFPKAETFAFVDLRAVSEAAATHKADLARHIAKGRGNGADDEAVRDLDQVIALMKLFEGGFSVVEIGPDLSFVHHKIGLVAGREKR